MQTEENKEETESEAEEGETKGAEMLDFTAPWCGHCKMMEKVVDQLREEWKGRVEVRKVDADAQRQVAYNHHIYSLPTFIFLYDGKEVDRVTGATTKDELDKRLKKLEKNELTRGHEGIYAQP